MAVTSGNWYMVKGEYEGDTLYALVTDVVQRSDGSLDQKILDEAIGVLELGFETMGMTEVTRENMKVTVSKYEGNFEYDEELARCPSKA